MRVVTGYGNYISAKDAWTKLVDKRGVGMKGWEAFQTHLGGAVSQGLLSKQRGKDSKGNMRTMYGPPELWDDDPEEFTAFADPPRPDIVVEKVQRPNRPSIEDIPLGDILSYNHVERDDIMSVLTDLIYDTPLRELRTRYPTLEDLVWDIVVGDE